MSSTANLRRIILEVKDIEKNSIEYEKMFTMKMIDENMYHWEALLYGPEDSLYEGYKFKIDINLPRNYPYSPPRVKFITPIDHFNVNTNGDICMDILKDKWSSSQNMKSILVSLISLMSHPNLEDPFNSDLADLYRTNEKEYIKKVKSTCKKNKF